MRLSSNPGPSFQDTARRVGRDLGQALAALLGALEGAPGRPNQLSRALGVNRDVASRVLGAASETDPLEVLLRVPGPEPLRRVITAAERRGAARVLADTARGAVEAFDDLIRRDAGTRAALDAMISDASPRARERFETASKYAVFKGMSQLKGVRAERWLGTAFVRPSGEDPTRLDLTWLTGAVALQRLRPGVAVRFGYRDRSHADPERAAPGPDARPGIETLEQFCVHPPARLQARAAGRLVHYTLPDELLGPREAVDLFVVDHHPAAVRRYAERRPPRRVSLFVEPAVPVETLVFDVALDAEAFPGAEPELVIYDTGYDGIANVNDRSRDIDRVDLRESVESLGEDLRRLRAPEVERYPSMLTHLCGRFGWDPARFRTYRTRIQYPVYGWQVCLTFAPPPRAT